MPRRVCCCLRCCARCGAWATRRCTTGWSLGPPWPWPAACRAAPMGRYACPAPPRCASAPLKVWRRADPDAQVGHAPAHHPSRFLRGYRLHTLLCRASGLPLFFRLAPANGHDAPFALPLVRPAVTLYALRPRIVRLDAAYWGLALIAWIHTTLGAVAVIPFNPKRTKDRSCLAPTWTRAELAKRRAIERFFGRLFRVFPLQRPPLAGWTALTQAVALTFTATIIVALAAQQAGRPDLIRSPSRVLAHTWEGLL